jgi:DNA-binding SARP family transcriptional activator
VIEKWRVLGPMRLRTPGGWVGVGAPKMRALLAVLLAEPGRVVSTERLVAELWGEHPGLRARKLVSQYVFRLRRLAGDPDGRVLVTEAPGYRLAMAAGEVDAGRFEGLVSAGREALRHDDAERAARSCAAALALWRGPALADVPHGPLVATEATRLEELRLTAVELRIEVALRAGQSEEFVPELRRLTAAEPLRERFWHQLMRALDQCGRPAEALAAYAQARKVLAEELGADPCPDLQRLHRRILTGHPVPAAGPRGVRGQAAATGPDPAARPAPRQLPPMVRPFVGRADQLRMLSGFLDVDSGAGAGLVASVIVGTAGVGKSALAVHWAHQVAGRFPDGQLYVNLHGCDACRPVQATDALAGFLRALGVAGPHIPAEAEERSAQYRSLLAGRRVLVLLDNAASVEQVRPLLPASSDCVAVVTSRDALAGLVARDGARRLGLGLLPLADAGELLATLIGDRAAADPEATAAMAMRCARLPLALRVAAEFAAARPAVPLARLAGELADQQRRLDAPQAGGDAWTAVRAAALPGPDLDHAQHLLTVLARAHLLQPIGPDRYGLHDLLRAYARELGAGEGGEDVNRDALTRLFDYHLRAAAAARAWLDAEPAGAPAPAAVLP